MEIKLQKWGNSIGIRIPMSFIKELKLKENDNVEIKSEDDKIIITKSNSNKIDLRLLFENYHGSYQVEEYDWGEPQGEEIW